MILFPFNENRFSFFFFFVADHLLVGQLCTNPKCDRNLLSCLRVTQCSTSEIEDAPLYISCSLPIQVMTTGPLPALSKCKSGLPRRTGTYPGYIHQFRTNSGCGLEDWPWGIDDRDGWKQCFRLRLWSLVWFQVKATSRHLTSSKSAWKSTSKCTWMCWRMWWSPGAIRWPVEDAGCGSPQVQRDPGLASEGVLRFYTLFSLPPSSNLNPVHYFVWSYVENITNMTSHNTKASLIAAIRRVFAELPPALVEKACSQFRIRIEVVIEAEGSYIE